MIGQTISHYTILEKLGEGGMGVVYKAQDTKLDRFVALKFLPGSVVSSPDDISRFEQEAKAISALNHASIATIHSLDEVDGKKFLVLEYIPGGTLKSKIKNLKSDGKVLAIKEVIEFGIQIAEGLSHAHRNQIVHRDIKSDNVMLTEEGKLKITDFGLAKLRGATHLTRTGSTIGTLAYMAPEQLRGEDIDYRADLFSFGIVLYELAAAHPPFRGEHEAAVMYSIANEDPSPLNSFRQDLPRALEQIILKCLQKNRTLRYQSADEIITDLQTLQLETTGTVKTVVVKQQSKLPWVIAATIVLLVVFGVYLFTPTSQSTGQNSKTIAVLPFTNFTEQKEDEYFSVGMTDDILTQLAKIADLKVISRTTMMQYKGTKKSVKEIGKELNAGIVLEGSVRRAGGQIRIVAQLINANSDEHLWADTYDREYKEVFAIQSEIAKKIAGSLQAKLSAVESDRFANPGEVNAEAYNATLQGRFFFDRRKKEDLEKAIQYFEKAIQFDSRYAPAWVGLSMVHTAQADRGYVKVDDGYRKARMEAEKALELDPNLVNAYFSLGWIKSTYDWDWTGADASFKKALELEPGNAGAISNSASLAATLGRFDEAITLDRKAVELDPLRTVAHYNLGNHALYAVQWKVAESAYRKTLELNPQYPGVFQSLGLLYLLQSKPEMALAEIQKEPEQVWRMLGLALVYHTLGKKNDADAALSDFIKEYQNDAAYQIAEIYAFRGETTKAFEWLERAYKQRDGGLASLKGDPLLHSIEKDFRYTEFMKKMKLPI